MEVLTSRRRRRRLLGGALAVTASLASAAPVAAAPGDADTAFSGDGFAFADQTASGYDGVSTVAMAGQPDGKLVVVVRATTSQYLYSQEFSEYVVRFNADGSIDRGFGDGGSVLLPKDWDWQYGAEGIAVQSSGRILVADTKSGVPGSGLSVLALNSQGSLDTSFGGGDGIAIQQLGSDWAGTYRLAVGPDDKIMLAGVQHETVAPYDQALAVQRLLPDGAPDPGFSGDGAVTFPSLDTTYFTPTSLSVDSAGRTVVTTAFDDRDGARQFPIVAIRLTDTGELDPAFSDGGIAVADTPDIPDSAGDGVTDSQGRVLAMAETLVSPYRSTVTRFTALGELDMSFGTSGLAGLDAKKLTVDSGDRPIVLALTGPPYGPVLGRLTGSGAPDPELPFAPIYPAGASSANGVSLLTVGERVYIGGSATMRADDQHRAFVFRAKLADSGSRDRDGDGIGDAADPCPYLYGTCPTLRRKLRLRFHRGFRSLAIGFSRTSECLNTGGIKIYKKRPGNDRIIKRLPPSTIDGIETPLKRRSGTIYAKTPAITIGTGRCPASRSNSIHVPRPK